MFAMPFNKMILKFTGKDKSQRYQKNTLQSRAKEKVSDLSNIGISCKILMIKWYAINAKRTKNHL